MGRVSHLIYNIQASSPPNQDVNSHLKYFQCQQSALIYLFFFKLTVCNFLSSLHFVKFCSVIIEVNICKLPSNKTVHTVYCIATTLLAICFNKELAPFSCKSINVVGHWCLVIRPDSKLILHLGLRSPALFRPCCSISVADTIHYYIQFVCFSSF